MSKVIFFTDSSSGGVSVCFPTGEVSIQAVQAKDVPNNTDSYVVEYEDLPNADNDFFDAWEQTNGVITVNFAKAKEFKKAQLRFDREPLLLAQDILFQRALENNLPTNTVVAEKNRLRDITLLVDVATTLDELRLINC